MLRLAFYQYVENRFLSQAKEEFVTDAARKFIGLNQVYAILRICFVEIDLARSGDLLTERFAAEYPRSAWVPLVQACVRYARQDYSAAESLIAAAKIPDDPAWAATYAFFSGVNRLKSAAQKLKSGVQPSEAGFSKAIEEFDRARTMLASVEEGYFKSIAVPSAQILRGIA